MKNEDIVNDEDGMGDFQLLYSAKYAVCNGILMMFFSSEYDFIDENEERISQVIYDDHNYFNNGLSSCEINDVQYIIDKENRIIIPIIYNEYDFTDELLKVKFNSKPKFVDINGNKLDFDKYEHVDIKDDILYVITKADGSLVFKIGTFQGNIEELKERLDERLKLDSIDEKYCQYVLGVTNN